jgi:hypothetical protein
MTPRLELVFVRGSDRGILYVYDDCGSGQVPGQIEELREIARTRYPEAQIHETPLDEVFEVRESGSHESRNSYKGCEEADPPGSEQARFIKATV